MHNYATLSLKALGDLIIEILYFPIWWYSLGLWNITKTQLRFLRNQEKSLALLVWIKNIFKPMYSQYDITSLVISFFIRTIQIFIRGLFLLFLTLVSLTIIIIWLSLPFLVINGIIYQIQ